MRYAIAALGIGAMVTIMGVQFANISNKLIRGCSPFAPDVVEFHPGVKLCPGQTVIMPAPKEEEKK